MNMQLIQLLALAGIAVYLVLKLRGVLGTREGHEGPRTDMSNPVGGRPKFEVIEGGPDEDITDHVAEDSDPARALLGMKVAESSFSVTEFLQGSKGAYEMILMAFENGDLASVQSFLSEDVYKAFASVIETRKEKGLTIEVEFIGVRETGLMGATFDPASNRGEVDVRFVCELTSVVKDSNGDTVEGDETEVKRQRDVWTFGRTMGSSDPNWQLVATGE
ncbi:MAG: Tim44/TimA family putative adaptor protein, partial [Planktomarina sp.]|nr:Tim44/TimA family putative adaptor protein [Planktomarina sp.]